jgi:uncharacterized protein (DUF1697 family)
MSNYIAMLRGINVSGHWIIKMEQLRASFAALGFSNVKTYIQSGNVVFEAAKDSAASLSKRIEQKILSDFGFPVPVFLRTSKEMEEIIKANPLLKTPGIDQTKLHVTFLAGEPPKTAQEQLQAMAAKTEQLRVLGRVVYLYCPEGYGNSKLANSFIEKKLSVGATTRNWTTVNTLLAMTH